MKKLFFTGIVMLVFVAQSAMADDFGLANGRSANMDNMADLSVDVGVNAGSDDYRLFGARINFKASPDLMVFGGVGQSEFRLDDDKDFPSSDGVVYGVGAFYQLRDVTLLENTDLAIKLAYHLGTLDTGGVDADVSEITAEALISGDQLGETDFGWYANVGVHIIKVSADSGVVDGDAFTFTVEGSSETENELGFGGGITGSLSFGEFFAGIDFVDGGAVVAGIRYNL